jgi:hypothetical protein
MIKPTGKVDKMLLKMNKKIKNKLPKNDAVILRGITSTSDIPAGPLGKVFEGMFVPLSQNTSRENIKVRVKLMLLNKEEKEKFFKELNNLPYDVRIDVLVGIIGDLKISEYVASQNKYKEIVDYIITSLRNEMDYVFYDDGLLTSLMKLYSKINIVNIDRKGNVVHDQLSKGIHPTIKLYKRFFVCCMIVQEFAYDSATNSRLFRQMHVNSLRKKILRFISQADVDNETAFAKYTSGLCLPCEFDQDSYIKDVIGMFRGLPIYLMMICGVQSTKTDSEVYLGS